MAMEELQGLRIVFACFVNVGGLIRSSKSDSSNTSLY